MNSAAPHRVRAATVRRAAGAWALAVMAVQAASAQPSTAAEDETAMSPDRPIGRIELKRQNTSRGTADESTRTTLRLELLHPGVVRLVRVDLPFPDETTDFNGDPFNPRKGDMKWRLGFRPWQSGVYRWPSFVELTLPTADQPAFGSGKYQLSAGLRLVAPLTAPVVLQALQAQRLEVELQQVRSFAGDPARKDIHYTKLELSLHGQWQPAWSYKLKLKPAVDWVLDATTGAVGEVEVGRGFAGSWRATLMFGRRLWGPAGVDGTYDDRVEATVSHAF